MTVVNPREPSLQAKFLSVLFGNHVTQDAAMQLYAQPQNAPWPKSKRFFGRTKAAEYAEANADKNIFFNCNLMAKGAKRGASDDARVVTTLYADIDTADGVHKTKPGEKLASKEEVLAMLQGGTVVPVPSILVDSGGGYHAYWLLDTPIQIGSAEDQKMAEDLLLGLNDRIKAWHKSKGCTYARLGDLARVLRVPGTFNHKTNPAKQVEIGWPKKGESPKRYTVTDLTFDLTAVDLQKPTAKVTTDFDGVADMAAAMKAANEVPAEWSSDASGYVVKICQRCVRYGLDADEAIEVVREMEAAKGPFPVKWSDADIAKRYADAAKKTPLGQALERTKAAKADPRDVAKQIIDASRHLDGTSSILWHQGALHMWSSGRWRSQSRDEARATITNAMDERYSHVLPASVSGAIEHIRALTYLADDCDHPTWLTTHEWPAHECFATADKIVHLPSYIDGVDNSEIDATPSFFTTSATDYAWTPDDNGCPNWLRFLNDLWPADPESIELLQMWFGYCLVADKSQHKMLLVLGPIRSGKGTIARTLTQLVGVGNVANPTLANMATEFGLQPLLEKSVGIISDMRLGPKLDSATATERLLSISGDDSLTVNRKHQPAIHANLPTRMMLFSNIMPQLRDASGALASRFLILEMKRSFAGCEDRGLQQRLLRELPGILHWSIAGYAKLRERGMFTETEGGLAAKSQLDELTSDIKAFIADQCEIGPDCECRADTAYRAYKQWCMDNAPSLRPSERQFGRDLKAAVTGLDRKRDAVDADGKRPWSYIGVKLLPSAANRLAQEAELEFSAVPS